MTFFLAIVHCSKFKDRREYLENLFSETKVKPDFWSLESGVKPFTWINSEKNRVLGRRFCGAGLDLGISARSLEFSRRRARLQGFILLIRFLITGKESLIMGSLPSPSTRLRTRDLEVQRMHLNALKCGLESKKEWILILEDDSRFNADAFQVVNDITGRYNSKKKLWMSLNSGAGLRRTKSDKAEEHFGLFRVKPPAVRCSAGYLISATLAMDLVTLINKYGLPDWIPIDYVYHLALGKIPRVVSFWQDPPIFTQGSETGEYVSGLR